MNAGQWDICQLSVSGASLSNNCHVNVVFDCKALSLKILLCVFIIKGHNMYRHAL